MAVAVKVLLGPGVGCVDEEGTMDEPEVDGIGDGGGRGGRLLCGSGDACNTRFCEISTYFKCSQIFFIPTCIVLLIAAMTSSVSTGIVAGILCLR